ncbi:MAG: FAD-dependent oxidoreductase [Dehalococcoidales bacterium]|nr:FAD-dependent oxidoreductase [Dehalococcoidales bacterium]
MKVCIIGAGDGGSTAAIQIRRLDSEAQIDIFSKRTSLGCPPCEIPLVIGGTIPSWGELVRGFRQDSFWEKRNVVVHLNTEVTGIDREERCVIANGRRYSYGKLILALGAIPVMPSFPGLDGKNEFSLSTDMAEGVALSNTVAQSSEAAIIGGGFIGLEIAAAIKARDYSKVYLLVRHGILGSYLDENMAERVKDVLMQNRIELILPAKIENIATKGSRKSITLSDHEVNVDFVFFATGAKPNVELAKRAGLKTGETDAIAVNEHLQTSDPDIYAIGDCMENWDIVTGSKRRHQLAANAIRTGYIAGRNVASGNHLTYEGTVMPFVTKIFGHQIGAVGFTEGEAKEKGLEAVSVTADTPRLRERFDGKPTHYKLIADAKTKTLIGAQIISEEIVSSTVDKLAVAIACKMPITKLVQIDSCYSPHVQEDQIAVPLHRLIDKLNSGGS